jgi:hypothetical protein
VPHSAGERGINTTSINPSKTDTDGFGGFIWRPNLTTNGKVVLLTRADMGSGQARFEWKANAGLEYRFKPWAGAMAGFSVFGINSTQTATPPVGTPIVASYDITQYGPAFSLLLHWGK